MEEFIDGVFKFVEIIKTPLLDTIEYYTSMNGIELRREVIVTTCRAVGRKRRP